METKTNYNIGLDIGTNSVGWAVCDENNQLIKYKGNNMWGSHLFDEGMTAEKRRGHRSTRRRFDRRRERIDLCQKLFADEVSKEDSNFFSKLKESSLYSEDKTNPSCSNIFTSKEYTDKDYSKEYPTIYHLRYDLMKQMEKKDIRLVYLAIHHILKYRGNFLYEKENFDVKNLNLQEALEHIFVELNEKYDYIDDFYLTDINYMEVKTILENSRISRSERQSLLIKELSNVFLDKKVLKEFSTLLVGLEAKTYLILDRNDLKDEKIIKIKFSDSKYEDSIEEIETLLQEDFLIIEELKKIYNIVFLSSLFKNEKEPSISKVMISKYDKHKSDLRKLKDFVKENLSIEEYNQLFKSNDKYSYSMYIEGEKHCSYDDFKKQLKRMVSSVDSIISKEIIDELDKDLFLRKLNVVENSLYPYQLNKYELETIIKTQGKYYPCLTEKTDDGTYKLIKLLEFRIPYYVGPLNLNADESGKGRSFAWLVKNKEEKITPYNFNEVVNLNLSAENFINRMTGFCTYLINEKVIPKNSLLYTKFNLLNELKQIRINQQKLSIDLINRIIQNLFLKSSNTNITDKIFKKWLIDNKEYSFLEKLKITGYQKENCFANNMKVYHDFISIFGIIDKSNYNMIEKMIEWITIFEDKKILISKIKEYYPNLEDTIISKIASKKYQGWARLSKELLVGKKILYIDNFEESHTIMNLLETTDENFMQILNNKTYHFEEKINSYNYDDSNSSLDVLEFIGKLPGSPAIKKGIYQSYRIIEEIIKLMGSNPTHIYVEMAREESDKKRTFSKERKLLDLYKKIKTNDKEYKELFRELEEKQKLDNRKLYLYFLQYGKCLYSGKPIHLNDLSQCEIDHIIPRTLIKDDSFDNLALVYKEFNQRKSDGLLLEDHIVQTQKNFWKFLYDSGFMTSKKYFNLIRKEFHEKDIEIFINRQLVETRQISKHVVELLNEVYGKDTVVSIHANLISDYKDKYELYKFRQVNNLHHAKDAYLAISLGSYLLKRFPKDKNLFIYNNYKKYFNKESKNYYNNMKSGFGYIIDNFDHDYFDQNGELIIEAKEFNCQIRKTYYYNDPLITRKTEIQTGEFYNQTLQNKNTANLISKKKGLNPIKYGGYTGENRAYYMLIKYNIKNETVNQLFGIPIMLYEMTKNGDKDHLIDAYIKEQIFTDDYHILKKCIRKNQLVKFKEQLCYIVSPNEVCNAVEFKMDKDNTIKFNKLLNWICNNKEISDLEKEKIDDLFQYILLKIKNNYPLFKGELEKITKFYSEGYYNQMELLEKKKLILELFTMLNTNSSNARLSFLMKYQQEIAFNDRVGRKGSQNINSGTFIFFSVTGLNKGFYGF